MMKIFLKLIFFVGLFSISGCTSQQVNNTLGDILNNSSSLGKPSTQEVIAGLKQALEVGTGKSASLASKVDGYYKNPKIKIPFPPDVKKVETKLRQIGMGKEVDRFILTLNRGAEKAAKEAKPVFVEAIRAMTIKDAWNILKGKDDEATQYLKRTTSSKLRSKFKPIVRKSLQSYNQLMQQNIILTWLTLTTKFL